MAQEFAQWTCVRKDGQAERKDAPSVDVLQRLRCCARGVSRSRKRYLHRFALHILQERSDRDGDEC